MYEPICVWNGTIVDGHNRWKIIQAHPAIPFRTKEMPFADKWEAFDWMYKKQLGRRNLSDENKTYLWGKIFEARKKIRGSNNQYVQAKSEKDQSDTFHSGDTAQIIANELGIGRQTVKRAEKFSKCIDSIKEMSAEAADKILAGGTKVTKKAVREFKELDGPKKKQFVDSVLSGEVPKQKAVPKQKQKIVDIANNPSREYTEQDAIDEFIVITDEFIAKAERMLRIRSKVTMRSKTIANLINEASDRILNLKGEIKCQ